MTAKEHTAPMLSELVEGLQILLKYGDVEWPTHCEHDVMTICNGCYDTMTDEDLAKLDELGFEWDEDERCFKSYAFGSA